MDSKYLRFEKANSFNIMSFKEWTFAYFLNEKDQLIKTTFYKTKEKREVLKNIDLKRTKLYKDIFTKYFETGKFSNLPKIDISDFPKKHKNVYLYLMKYWNQIFYYGELADLCGIKNGARFIGYLMKMNPLPVLVPCHHVIGKNNPHLFSLGGDLKRALLALESRTI
ncbi:MGMT family protein [bacterium]|nr:MGMT family protein [bacterium]